MLNTPTWGLRRLQVLTPLHLERVQNLGLGFWTLGDFGAMLRRLMNGRATNTTMEDRIVLHQYGLRSQGRENLHMQDKWAL